MFKKDNKSKYTKGTTLLELVVVISIFVIISGVTIFNYGQFNSSMSTQNLVDDIALTVRRAQSYAIGVRGVNDVFTNGYGIHFSLRSYVSGQEYKSSTKSFVLFADLETIPNHQYNYSSYNGCGSPTINDECMEILNILSSDSISSVKMYGTNNTAIAELNGDKSLDIVFYRPNPEPKFCYRPYDSYCDPSSESIVYVKIEVTNVAKDGTLITRTIRISNSGQISVSETND